MRRAGCMGSGARRSCTTTAKCCLRSRSSSTACSRTRRRGCCSTGCPSVRFALPDFPLNLVWVYIVIAFAVATLIGVISGLAPAAKAARMDPVEALRAE